MKLPLSWLKEYLDLPFSPEKIGDTLTLAGLEVDHIEFLSPQFTDVVVAIVQKTEPHPKADRLQIAEVFDGKDTWQVVCGAKNCRPNIKVAFARIGARLKDLQIKKSTLRDVDSFGMLCGWDELGLAGGAEGIAELFHDMELGSNLSSFYSDVVFTISLTPNLGHCMSVYGVARELSAFLKVPLRSWIQELRGSLDSSIQKAISVTVEDPILCPRYSCRLVRSVHNGPSPSWLARRLELSGLRSVSLIVDISNYVMLLTGQPLHFFDYDAIQDQRITIGPCIQDTSLVTLDGAERILPKGTLVIRDQAQILAVGGIIGALEGAISDQTKTVLIEAARFDPIQIQRTSKALGCKTDASIRFEKGIDPLMTVQALDLAALLLSSEGSGEITPGLIDLHPKPFMQKQILCRMKKVNALLGTNLSLGEIADLLMRLDMTLLEETPDFLLVAVPPYRNDISLEVDLIEEIARLYGFDHLPKRAALHVSSPLLDAPIFVAENRARSLLIGEGLQEFLTCDLMSPVEAKIGLPHDRAIEPLTVLQSKSSDYSTLRPSLLPGLLQLVKYNIARQNLDIAGFEVGRIHFQEGKDFHERASIGLVLSGHSTPYHPFPKPKEVDFFDLKGMVENLLDSFGLTELSFEVSHLSSFQPGKQAFIRHKGIFLGALGEIHPCVRQKLGIEQRVFFAEIDLQDVYELQKTNKTVEDLALMPSSERDWTLTLAKHKLVDELLSCVRAIPSRFLEKISLLDVFENEKIGSDKKNITLRFVYRGKDKTLDFETVEQEHAKLVQKVAEKLGNCIL